MAKTTKEVLKELNKNRSEGDLFKFASDVPREQFDVVLSSTGSPNLDYQVGGIGRGRMTLITGWEGSGKTSFALICAREIQKKFGEIVVFFDGEDSVTNSHLDRFEIDRELFILRKGNALEEMLNEARKIADASDVGAIIIDSVTSYASTVLEEKDAEEYTIGIEAKRWNTNIPIIMGKCRRNGISLIPINQIRENPGITHGSADVLPRGHWQKFYPSLHLDFGTKRDKILLYDENKNLIGHTLDVRVKKSRYDIQHSKGEKINVNFYYEYGFDRLDEFANLFVTLDIIEQKGSWFHFPNGHKEQGFEGGVCGYLEENPEYFEELVTMVGEIKTITTETIKEDED